MKRPQIERMPKAWQRDPTNITTSRVQFWRNGVLVTVMDAAIAKENVEMGIAFVMCDQAIGALIDGEMRS